MEYRYQFISLLCVALSVSLGAETQISADVADSGNSANEPHDGLRAVSFVKDIRPILSANCFECHGPDENTREADLRLDDPEAAYADLGGYAALVPGDPNTSELVRRIESDEEYEQMPPVDSGKQLSSAEIATLKKWITQGGEYEPHWAFVSPRKAAAPDAEDTDWPRNAIDNFVLAQLKGTGLSPSPEAGRYQLVRRVYLDLIGLPPTIEEADSFVNDNSPDAYERLVDRLLASPHYGERWARRWLDLARYSDTKGYEKDQPRTMWLYREWVINALNQDMPFDQFTIEQLAGDMLPHATAQQRIATGFHRNTMTNEEGGIDPQEFRFHSIVDRVATTGTTWLGLTVGCAQCHTHKFDPITHTEYYSLFAFLNNADEPKIEVAQESIEQERAEIQIKIDRIVETLQEHYPVEVGSSGGLPVEGEEISKLRRQTMEADFAKWKAEQRERVVRWTPIVPAKVESNLPVTEVLDDASVLCSGDITKNDVFTLHFPVPNQTITAIRLEALPHHSLPGGGPGRQSVSEGPGSEGSFFLSEAEAWLADPAADGEESLTPIKWGSASASFAAAEKEASLSIDGKHDTGWAIFGREAERHTIVWRFAEPVTVPQGARLRIRLSHENYYSAALGRFRISVTAAEKAITATGFSDAVNAALSTDDESLTDGQNELLLDEFLLSAPALKPRHDKIAELKQSLPEFPTALVMQQRDPKHARQTFRHHRGEFMQPKEEVKPGVLQVLHELSTESRPTRLTLAEWLVDRDNPLVARVVMNRHWEAFFGRGLVRTTEDFGYQGEYPTHPELLDWLAVEFMESGWSLKHMHKLIVMSSTYRQSSAITPRQLELDPENKLLCRAPSLRLEAEVLRDFVLASSGLLSEKIGGPSVFPPQPPGITEAAYGALNWIVSEGEDRYRRGLYTFNKRTAPYAAFGLFDAPSGEVCVPRRIRSNTPLQSLAMLNDEVVMEAARFMAGECMEKYGDDNRAIAIEQFRRCATRPPEPEELESVLGYFENQLERFRNDLEAANRVLNTGPVVVWNTSEDLAEWEARNHAEVRIDDAELVVTSTGEDPFIGANVESPPGQHSLKLRAHFEKPGTGEVYWTTLEYQKESPKRRAVFEIVPNQWHEYVVRFDADSDLKSLRLDIGQSPGVTKIEHLRLAYGDDLYVIRPEVDRAEFAAWLLTARVLLNLDETITKP